MISQKNKGYQRLIHTMVHNKIWSTRRHGPFPRHIYLPNIESWRNSES